MTQTPKRRKTDKPFSMYDAAVLFVVALMFGPLLVSCVVGNGNWVAGSFVWVIMWIFAGRMLE